MRRGKKAWVVEMERRTRVVPEPPDGPAPKQELTTAFVTKFGQETLSSSFLEKRTEEQNGLGELLLFGNLYVKQIPGSGIRSSVSKAKLFHLPGPQITENQA